VGSNVEVRQLCLWVARKCHIRSLGGDPRTDQDGDEQRQCANGDLNLRRDGAACADLEILEDEDDDDSDDET
jgi:hypothetical protein